MQLEEAEIAEKKREDLQKSTQDYIKKAQVELAQKSDIVKDHAERANNLKSAYNADRRMLQERIEELKGHLKAKDGEINSLK